MRQSGINRYFTMFTREAATPCHANKQSAPDETGADCDLCNQASSLPSAFNSRSASASRAETSGNSGSEPTSVV